MLARMAFYQRVMFVEVYSYWGCIHETIFKMNQMLMVQPSLTMASKRIFQVSFQLKSQLFYSPFVSDAKVDDRCSGLNV